jgi:hypothetical protein
MLVDARPEPPQRHVGVGAGMARAEVQGHAHRPHVGPGGGREIRTCGPQAGAWPHRTAPLQERRDRPPHGQEDLGELARRQVAVGVVEKPLDLAGRVGGDGNRIGAQARVGVGEDAAAQEIPRHPAVLVIAHAGCHLPVNAMCL